MSTQTSNTLLTPGDMTDIIALSSGAEHGFMNLLVSNSAQSDASVTVYISSSSTPTTQDIIIPDGLVASKESITISCALMVPGEKVFAVTDANKISVRATIIEKVA